MTSDKVLIVNPEVCLGKSTNANTTFKATKKNVTLTNEACVNDYLVPDFKLADIKTLRRI